MHVARRPGDFIVRILFVGGEDSLPLELVGLVGDMDDSWQVQRAEDGAGATALIAEASHDVVVVAPSLPDMPVATLLGQIRTLRPETSRIAVIGGQPPARVLSLAHRFLPLPVGEAQLLEAIGSLEELRELLDNPVLRERIGQIEKLPSPPQTYLALAHALEAEDETNANDIAQLISGDPAIAAKVLQLCNSAYFSAGRTITDLRSAVTRLGMATMRDLVLASEVFAHGAGAHLDRPAMQQRALVASQLARRMLPESSAELGATAALLADIGLLLPGIRDERAPAETQPEDAPGHTEAGAYLLGLWGLPMPIIEAVAFQRTPARAGTRSFWVTGAVHVATALAAGEPVHEDYLQRTGMIDKLDGWRGHAERLLGLADVQPA
ncbi:HDOD domain-containing protein [Luteimonas deserti]|uniref:HDOD domain-containing protein n=1 Tax=Luteimonas deserti TaxID=2752306 RepID=A0A7Z0U0N3_9GAMM|nr:HDOD domain-containing protein [Luteimonas deserti]NYZ63458.1 HDOD domain-containing protein [Luteimonas deserti]